MDRGPAAPVWMKRPDCPSPQMSSTVVDGNRMFTQCIPPSSERTTRPLSAKVVGLTSQPTAYAPVPGAAHTRLIMSLVLGTGTAAHVAPLSMENEAWVPSNDK